MICDLKWVRELTIFSSFCFFSKFRDKIFKFFYISILFIKFNFIKNINILNTYNLQHSQYFYNLLIWNNLLKYTINSILNTIYIKVLAYKNTTFPLFKKILSISVFCFCDIKNDLFCGFFFFNYVSVFFFSLTNS